METNFNFNSQICTDKIQSERLLALGLKKETADMRWANSMGNSSGTTYYLEIGTPYYDCDIPAWSLHRLLMMTTSKSKVILIRCESDLFDVIIQRIEHDIKAGYFNKEYLV